MTTFSTSFNSSMTSDAVFRTLVSNIRGGIESVITRASDTGQIDTTTVTIPGSNNVAAGYNIYRLPGGTQDVYMKIYYGRGSSSTIPSLWFQFGTATDGAGTLSGATTATRQLGLSSANATPTNCYFSADTGRFAFVLWDNDATTTNRIVVSCERDWDAAGTANESYYYALYHSDSGSGTAKFNRCVRVSGDVWREHSVLNGTWPADSSTFVLGLDIAAYPIRPIYGTERNPSRNWHVVGVTDVAVGTVFNADLYGVTHTWLRVSPAVNEGQSRSNRAGLCMRWE